MSYMPRHFGEGPGRDPRPAILDRTITLLEDDMRRLEKDIDLIQAAYLCAERVLALYKTITGHYLDLVKQDIEAVEAIYEKAEADHLLINAHEKALGERRERDLDELRSL